MRQLSSGLMPMPMEAYLLGKNLEAPLYMPADDTRLYAMCREAFFAAIQATPSHHKRAILPAYTCETCIMPFVQQGWTCSYYGVGKDLRIDTEYLLKLAELIRPEIVLVHPYYGMDLNEKELDALAKVKAMTGCVIIEDLTQTLFSKLRTDVIDVYVGSMRKWFPTADGGYAITTKLELAPTEDLAEFTPYVDNMTDAMCMRECYEQYGDTRMRTAASHFNARATAIGRQKIELHRMSDFSRRIVAAENWEENNRKRRENSIYLYEKLQGAKNCTLVYSDVSEIANGPLWFPIYADRAAIRPILREYQIAAPGLWPVETAAVQLNPTVDEIYSTILALSMSQDYTQEDLDRIVACMNA